MRLADAPPEIGKPAGPFDTLSPVGKLIPERGRERTEVRTWEALADGLMDAAILARLEQTWAGRTAEQRSAVAKAMRPAQPTQRSASEFTRQVAHLQTLRNAL